MKQNRNPFPPRRNPSRQLSTWLAWLMVCMQLITLLSTATVGAIQPTPELAQGAVQALGLNHWFTDVATALAQFVQPLFGAPQVAYAQAAPVLPVVNASPTSVSFGSVSVGGGSMTQTVTIANIASAGSTVSGGGYTTCAVTSTGGVKCWGWNGLGQLGDGTNYNRTAPGDVVGLQSGVVTVQNSYYHTCALTTSGGVKCWGYNGWGQLGDGSQTARSTPVDVTGLTSGVLAIAVGQYHSCALTNQGAVMCWGWNGLGQLGDATNTEHHVPVVVSGLTTGVSAIVAGENFSCALTTSGNVKCWGYNGEGQLGDGSNTIHSSPVDVSGLTSGVKAIGAGERWACAITTGGAAKCWGYNGNGTLGNGSTSNSNVPVNVSGLTSGVSSIEGGLYHTCALTTSGGVKCWGYDAEGELGDGGNSQRTMPADVNGLTSSVSAIGVGYLHSCAVLSTGAVKCWGYNGYGQVGDGTVYNRNIPVNTDGQPVLFATPALSAASAGGLNTCALTANGGAKCWGYNDFGQLGNGAFNSGSQAPMDVVGLTSGVTQIANNYFHTCAIVNGAAQCWGYNGYGELGNGSNTNSNAPVNVAGLSSGVTAIATGEYFSCAVVNGGVKCWGYGGHGQLGNGSTSNSSVPVSVSGLTSGVSAIGVGNYHACAALSAGGVKCWGWDGNGQLGDGANNGANPTPVAVSGLNSTVVTALTGDWEHTCALTSSGGVKCWGYNGNGQLGDGSTTNRNTPVDVTGLTSGVTAIDTGYHHTCALTSGGGVKCWGYNGLGQVGDNTINQRNTPVDVTGLTSGVTALAVGRYHSCAITSDGNMQCWGYAGLGQLGDGFFFNRYKPGAVSTLIGAIPGTVGTLSITNISLSGTDAADFTIVGGTCGNTFPISLAQGAGCTVLLKANPASTGTGKANLVVNSNDSTQPINNIPLDVTTADPHIDVSPRNLNFGNVNLGITSPAQLITIRNLASAGGVMRSGANSLHTCSVTNLGGVKCWGYNAFGQLGNGSITDRWAPVDVNGLTSGVTAVSVGTSHTCALTSSGGVKCWGLNVNGQLGNGSTTNSNVPVDVTGLTSGVIAIATGDNYSCALTTSGGVKCWGYNAEGQLGYSTSPATQSTVPGLVTNLSSGVSAIDAGFNHTCALTSSGGMKCWGYNGQGQLGFSTAPLDRSATPGDVTGLTSGVSAMTTGGYHTCAILNTGGVKCWGRGDVGQLGNGANLQQATPVDVNGLSSGVTAIDAGLLHTCALLSSGGLKCWGYNAEGELGDGSNTARNVPADVLGLTSGIGDIATGRYHSCATTTTGGGKCWGYNGLGQLGDGTALNRNQAVNVSGQPNLFATPSIAAAAAGGFGSCAVTASKGIKCWGNDEYLHLGDGDGLAINRTAPVDVSGLTSGAAQVSTARYHACAVLIDGSMKCWGQNVFGQLGDGSTTDRPTPTDVSGFGSGSGGSITNISGGYQSTCALTSAGGIKCWGQNVFGQLGDGSTTNRSAPTPVTGITSGATAVENGTYHTCAIVSGGAKCWGYNAEGQLGDSTNSQRLTPVNVTGLGSGVTAIVTGEHHSCAVVNGGAKCWGGNAFGQLGDGSTTNSNTPVDVSGLTSGVTALAINDMSTCALLSSGAVKCWGGNNDGQLGDGTTTQRLTPVAVSGLSSGVTAIEGSEFHDFCAIVSGGMKCWGYNAYGQLGDGTTTNRTVPTDVSGLTSGVTAMKGGRLHTCAIVNGGMKCWGYNGYGQLGDGSTTNRIVPTDVSGLTSGVTKLAAGEYYTCALVGGVTKCWGYNGYGQLGDGSINQHNTPTDVAIAVSGVTYVATSQQHTCALTSDGAVKCWGDNTYGQLGDGTTTQRTAPVQVSALTSGVVAIAVGENFSCALTQSGGVKCWGRNDNGRLGDGTITQRSLPTDVSGLTSGVSAIGVGDAHGCAALTAGGVKCWGYNANGALGDGTVNESHVPVAVSGLGSTVISALSGGYRHTCALTSSGGMKCWGYNSNGQLGYGTSPAVQSTTPNDVTGLTSGVTSIAVGTQHSCAILTSGQMQCWGYNGNGQLGDGTVTDRTASANVATLINGVASTIGALNVTGIDLGGGDTNQFAIASGGTCSSGFPFSLAAGVGCTVAVTFGPASYGDKLANVKISSNDPLSPTIYVALTGKGVGPDLLIGKSGPTTAVQGAGFSYALVITNTGNSATGGSITVSDILPSGMSLVSGSGSGFSCSAVGQNVTCTGSTAIAINGTATINLNVNTTALGVVANVASVSGGGDSTLNTSSSANTSVGAPPPDLTTVIGQPSPNFTVGISSTVPMTVSNIGVGPSASVITTTMTLPANTSAPATFTDGTWICSTTGQIVTCRQPNALLPGDSSTAHVPVTPNAATVGTQLIFNGTVSTPNESNTVNNNATPMTSSVAVTPILPIKVFLGGPYVQSTGLMTDALRAKNYLPTTEPYSALSSFTHKGGGGGESVNAGVFTVTGNNAIVDWVFVELRSTITNVVATRSALVQRDGDVVGMDGATALQLPGSYNAQSYYVVVWHRNHLGVMTLNPITLSDTTALVDFTNSATLVYGANAMKTVGSSKVLWSGNINANKSVINAGPSNDVDPILVTVFNAPGNSALNRNYIVNGYNLGDLNLDGKTIAAGPNNDVNPILINVFTHPVNTTQAANYIIQEQVP